MSEILWLVWIHFCADFVLQSDAMAKGKSKDSRWLALHVGIYALCFIYLGWVFAAITFVAHFWTDYVSSRITSRLWAAKETHWFFAVIGADQALHMTQLLVTYRYLKGWP